MKDEKQINQMSPLTWAYVGDAVYELYVRSYLIDTTNLKPNNLHKESIKYVKARAQAEILSNLQEILTEEEIYSLTNKSTRSCEKKGKNEAVAYGKELDNQPKVKGYLGPIFERIDYGKVYLRYETQEIFNMLST